MRLKSLFKTLFISLFFLGLTDIVDARQNSDLRLLTSQVSEQLVYDAFEQENAYLAEAVFAVPSSREGMQSKAKQSTQRTKKANSAASPKSKRPSSARRPSTRPTVAKPILSTKTTKTTKTMTAKPVTLSETKRRREGLPVIGFKTDFLKWGGLLSNMYSTQTIIPNLGLEFYFGKAFSISIEGSYSNWKKEQNELWYQYLNISVEPRYWIPMKNNDPFLTPYLGAYGIYEVFDVNNKKSAGVGTVGFSMGGGLSLGCGLPITKSIVINVGIRAGYSLSTYDNYAIEGRMPIGSQEKEKGFILQGISMSLVFRIIPKTKKKTKAATQTVQTMETTTVKPKSTRPKTSARPASTRPKTSATSRK